MTHAEAAALFPHCKAFPDEGKSLGEPFGEARKFHQALGMDKVSTDTTAAGSDEIDGTLVPGLDDNFVPKYPKFRYMGAVTLYWRDLQKEAARG